MKKRDARCAESSKSLAELKWKRAAAEMLENAEEAERVRLAREHASLDTRCVEVTAGDRESMLLLIEVTSRTLRSFDGLPQEFRIKLASGLDKVVKALSQSPDFERGKLSTLKKRKHEADAWRTAWQVERCRYSRNLSLDAAEAEIAEEFQIKQDLVHKRWKRSHVEAKRQIEMFCNLLMLCGVERPFRRKEKKVR